MKQYLSTILWLCLSLVVRAQIPVTFNDTIAPFGTYHNHLVSVCYEDSFYYVLGEKYNSDYGNWNVNLLKLDKQGGLQDKIEFLDSNSSNAAYPYNTIAQNNNSVIVCTQVTKGSHVYGKVLALNKHNLDTLWTKSYAHPDTATAQTSTDVFSEISAIKPITGGGYILAGNYNKNCVTGNLRSFLMKINDLGNVEWRKTYDDLSYLFDIELTPSGGYTFISKFFGHFIVETDSVGNILWKKEINSNEVHATVGDVSYASCNQFVGVLKYKKNSDPNYDLYGVNVIKYDLSTQQILWDKYYHPYYSLECISLHEGMGVEVLPNGEIVISGTADDPRNTGFIMKLNSSGDSLWSRTYNYGYSGNNDCQLNDLLICEDGGFLGIGYYAPIGSHQTAWMFKTDSNGLITDLDSPNFPKTQVQIDCYPNPARSQLTLEWHSPIPQKGILEVYNPLGSLILQEEIRSGKQKLNLHNWQAGVYLYRLVLDGEVLGAGKFVKEP